MSSKAKEIEMVDENDFQKEETATTKVKVRFTSIKFFNEETNAVEEIKIMGKMSVPEIKKHIKELNAKNVYINKENIDEEFNVNTVALYQLKEV